MNDAEFLEEVRIFMDENSSLDGSRLHRITEDYKVFLTDRDEERRLFAAQILAGMWGAINESEYPEGIDCKAMAGDAVRAVDALIAELDK